MSWKVSALKRSRRRHTYCHSNGLNIFDCERMQRSPIHSFVVVVVFDFQVCEIFVLNEGKLKHVDKTCWQNLLTKPVDKTCSQNMLTKPVVKLVSWHGLEKNDIFLTNMRHGPDKLEIVLTKMTWSWKHGLLTNMILT